MPADTTRVIDEPAETQELTHAQLDAQSESLLDQIMGGVKPDAGETAIPKPGETPAGEGGPSAMDLGSEDFPEDVAPVPKKKEEPPKPDAGAEPVKPKVDEPQFKDPKQAHAFAQLRHENAELARKMAAVTAELEKFKTGAAASPQAEQQLAALQEQHAREKEELEARIGQYDLASTKSFKLKYDAPLNGMIARASALLQKAGVSQEDADQAARDFINQDTMSRATKLQEMVPALAAPLVNLFEDFDELRGQRDSALRDWKASRAALGEDQRVHDQSKAIELAETLAAQVLEQQAEQGNPFFKRSAVKPEWNAQVDEQATKFRGVLKTGDQVTLANLVAEGLTAQRWQAMYQQLRQQHAALREEVNAKFGMIPTPRGRPAGDEPPPNRQPVGDDNSIIDGILDKHLPTLRRYPGTV